MQSGHHQQNNLEQCGNQFLPFTHLLFCTFPEERSRLCSVCEHWSGIWWLWFRGPTWWGRVLGKDQNGCQSCEGTVNYPGKIITVTWPRLYPETPLDKTLFLPSLQIVNSHVCQMFESRKCYPIVLFMRIGWTQIYYTECQRYYS